MIPAGATAARAGHNKAQVPGAITDGWSVHLLMNGALWNVAWDGKVTAEPLEDNYFSDALCEKPVTRPTAAVQRAFQSGSDYYLPKPPVSSGPIYAIYSLSGGAPGCNYLEDGSYFDLDLDNPLTRPDDLQGPLTLGIN